jgi:hypothetical protein
MNDKKSDFPCPNVSRFKDYESPVTGKWISSDRQREQDLYQSNSYDPRDLPKDHRYTKGRDAQKEIDAREPQQLDFWRDQ